MYRFVCHVNPPQAKDFAESVTVIFQDWVAVEISHCTLQQGISLSRRYIIIKLPQRCQWTFHLLTVCMRITGRVMW